MRNESNSIAFFCEQMTETSSALWAQRERLSQLRAGSFRFADLVAMDERLDAQLDALRTCGESGLCSVRQALSLDGAGERFTAAVFIKGLGNGDASWLEAELAPEANPTFTSVIRPLAAGLHWIGADDRLWSLERIDRISTPAARAVTLTAEAMTGIADTAKIAAALETDDAVRVESGIWAALRMDSRELRGLVEQHLERGDLPVTMSAAKALALWGSNRAHPFLERVARDPESEFAMDAGIILMQCYGGRDRAAFHAEIFHGAKTRAAIFAAGASGAAELIPFLLEQCGDEKTAGVAAESFGWITGLDLESAGLTLPLPKAKTENDDEPVGDDDLLPQPNVEAMTAWWRDHQNDFPAATQLLWGQPVTPDWLRVLLGNAPQKIRIAAAELSVTGGMPLEDVKAPAFRQTMLSKESPWA